MITRIVRSLAFGRIATRYEAHAGIKAARWISEDGRTVFILSRNMDGHGGPWRVSRFDSEGDAIGHVTGSTAQGAIDNGIAGWGAVRLVESR